MVTPRSAFPRWDESRTQPPPVEQLTVGKASGDLPTGQGLEVTVEVAVPGAGGVVEQAAVELQLHQLGVGDVPVDTTSPSHLGRLAFRECGQEPLSRRTTGGDSLGQCCDRCQVIDRRRSHVDHGVLVPHAGRAEVPLHLLAVVQATVDAYAGRLGEMTTPIDDDVDGNIDTVPLAGAISGPQRRGVAQCRRPGEQHRRPRVLEPRELAGVVDVDAFEDRGPLAPTQHPSDVVIRPLQLGQLPSGDDTRLQVEQLIDFWGHRKIVSAATEDDQCSSGTCGQPLRGRSHAPGECDQPRSRNAAVPAPRKLGGALRGTDPCWRPCRSSGRARSPACR